jgi:hypothetical protein
VWDCELRSRVDGSAEVIVEGGFQGDYVRRAVDDKLDVPSTPPSSPPAFRRPDGIAVIPSAASASSANKAANVRRIRVSIMEAVEGFGDRSPLLGLLLSPDFPCLVPDPRS